MISLNRENFFFFGFIVLVLNMLGFLSKTLDTMNVISKEKTLIKNHFPDRKKN